MDASGLFEILAREHAAMLGAFIRASVREPQAVDDLFQETMLTAWERLDDFDRERPFGPWLRGIAAKKILVFYRKSQKLAAGVDPSVLDYLSDRCEELSRLEGETLHDKLAALRACVEALPDRYREVVRLRYVDDHLPQAIAGELSMAVDSIKKRLFRAKQRLHECLSRKLQSLGAES